MAENTEKSDIVFTLPKGPHIQILEREVKKMMTWCAKASGETSGLGLIKPIINNSVTVSLQVYKVYLLEQTCTNASTKLDDTSILRLLDELDDKETANLKFWWHTHANMGVFWSGPDVENIERNTSDYTVSLVINQKGDMKARIDQFKPYHFFLDNVPVYIPMEISDSTLLQVSKNLMEKNASFRKILYELWSKTDAADKEELEKELESKVRKSVTHYVHTGNGFVADKDWQKEWDEWEDSRHHPVLSHINTIGNANNLFIELDKVFPSWTAAKDSFPIRPSLITLPKRDEYENLLKIKLNAKDISTELYNAELEWLKQTSKIIVVDTKQYDDTFDTFTHKLWGAEEIICGPYIINSKDNFEKAVKIINDLHKNYSIGVDTKATLLYILEFCTEIKESIGVEDNDNDVVALNMSIVTFVYGSNKLIDREELINNAIETVSQLLDEGLIHNNLVLEPILVVDPKCSLINDQMKAHQLKKMGQCRELLKLDYKVYYTGGNSIDKADLVAFQELLEVLSESVYNMNVKNGIIYVDIQKIEIDSWERVDDTPILDTLTEQSDEGVIVEFTEDGSQTASVIGEASEDDLEIVGGE
jgi:hypothetical protein